MHSFLQVSYRTSLIFSHQKLLILVKSLETLVLGYQPWLHVEAVITLRGLLADTRSDVLAHLRILTKEVVTLGKGSTWDITCIKDEFHFQLVYLRSLDSTFCLNISCFFFF